MLALRDRPPEKKHPCDGFALSLICQDRLSVGALIEAKRKLDMPHIFIDRGGLSAEQVDRVPLSGAGLARRLGSLIALRFLPGKERQVRSCVDDLLAADGKDDHAHRT